MRLPTSIPRKNLGDIGLRIAKKAAGDAEQIERFAEHPYLEIFMDDYRVDIVPCYDAAPGEWQSATDRTPYHTDYIRTHLAATKCMARYGCSKSSCRASACMVQKSKSAASAVTSANFLVMKYGSFAKVIEAFAAYNKRIVIDLEGFYAERERELGLAFP